jgi:hypothetical protein
MLCGNSAGVLYGPTVNITVARGIVCTRPSGDCNVCSKDRNLRVIYMKGIKTNNDSSFSE